jgi:phosphoglucomutase
MAGSVDTATLLSKVAEAVAGGRLTATAGQNVQRWLTTSGYLPYVPRVAELIVAGKWDDLDAKFWEVIPFGTGGRRGPMSEFGSATMNDRTVAESADGLAAYFLATLSPGQERTGRAVIAHDTRNRSADFARIAAQVLAGHGLTVFLFESFRSTPELSFAVRHLKCDVGAMISASHNPPADNGFKAYWSNGAQVLPPHDKGIIEAVYRSNEIPMADYDAAVAAGKIVLVGEEVDAAYIKEVVAQSLSTARDLPILYTPLHGVGETSAFRSLREAGFTQATIFEGQRKPDGNFPGVPKQLPNPELPAVFDPPLVEARAKNIPLILASDPDADRLGVCVRGRDGSYTHLSGNRIGVLLADYILRKRAAAGRIRSTDFICETLVTTPLVGAIGRKHGVRVFDELLVGFKYIAQLMDRVGPEHFVFGAEESLGYLTGSYARDKDASVAALLLSEAAAELKQEGKTLLDRLDELFVEHGYFLETQKSETRTGPRGKAQIDQLMSALAANPPEQLAGLPFQRVRDYIRHEVRTFPGNTRTADLPEPKGDMLVFEAVASDCAVTLAVRPSGTEPKIKFYFFARAAVADAASLGNVRIAAEKRLGEFTESLLAWAGRVWET